MNFVTATRIVEVYSEQRDLDPDPAQVQDSIQSCE